MTATLNLPEKLTFANAVQSSEALKAALSTLLSAEDHGLQEQDNSTVVVDAAAVEQFDSAALAVLLQCRRDILMHKYHIAIKNMPPRLRELSRLYGVESLLPDVLA